MLRYASPVGLLLGLVLIVVSSYLVFFVINTDVSEGGVQRIFYTHVPAATLALILAIVVAIFSVLYLATKKFKYDQLASSFAEIGVLLGGLVLVQGMIWSRPTWGVWWNNDPKNVTTLVLFLIFVAYLVFRAYFPHGQSRARLSAIIAIVGAVNAPLVYYATEIFGSVTHPGKVIPPIAGEAESISTSFLLPLGLFTLATFVVFGLLVSIRYRVAKLERKYERITQR